MTLTADHLNTALRLPHGLSFAEFRPQHIEVLEAQNPGGEMSAFDLENIYQSVRRGVAFTLTMGDRVVAIFGLVFAWPGLAEGWMHTTPAAKPVAVAFTYALRRFCAEAARVVGLRRIQIHVDARSEVNLRWARAAKFQREAVLPSYWPDGSPAILMARLFRG